MRFTVNFIRNMIAIGLAFLLFFAFSCASSKERSANTQSGPDARAGEKSQEIMKSGWEAAWGKALEQGKKERNVVIYAVGSVAPGVKEATGLFKQKFGIELDVVSFGRGAEQMSRLFAERRAGLYLADIFMSGMNTQVSTKEGGAFDPLEPALILPEVVDPKPWYLGKLPWGDKDHTIINYFLSPVSPIAINKQLMKIDDIKSYYDLLSPKYKGKIVMNDPTTTGVGSAFFSSLVYYKDVDPDYFNKLVKQEPVVMRDQNLQVDWLAKGKYPIALWPRTQPMVEYIEAGAPIAYTPIPKEGTYLQTSGSSIAIINRTAHPNAARVFINWLLSKEGQKYMQTLLKLHSAREDISTEGLDPLNIRNPGVKYMLSANVIEEWLLAEQDKSLELAKQFFGPLTR